MTKYEALIPALHKIIRESLARQEYHFPTEAALCREFSLSRVTVRKALQTLEDEGLIRRQQGSGSFLTGLSPDPADNVVALLLTAPLLYRSPTIVEQTRRVIQEAGFFLAVYDMKDSFQTERCILTELIKHPPRGLLLECFSSTPDPNADLLQQLVAPPLRVPVVTLLAPFSASGMHATPAGALSSCLEASSPAISFVAEESLSGARLLVNTMSRLGHRRIAGIFPACSQPDALRLQSLLTSFREADLPIDPWQFFLPGNIETAEILQGNSSLLDHFMEHIAGTCTALVCSNDLLAVAASRRAAAHGLRIPLDLALASMEESYVQDLSSPRISSLSGLSCLGECAARLLIQKIRGAAPESLLLPLTLTNDTSLCRI